MNYSIKQSRCQELLEIGTLRRCGHKILPINSVGGTWQMRKPLCEISNATTMFWKVASTMLTECLRRAKNAEGDTDNDDLKKQLHESPSPHPLKRRLHLLIREFPALRPILYLQRLQGCGSSCWTKSRTPSRRCRSRRRMCAWRSSGAISAFTAWRI